MVNEDIAKLGSVPELSPTVMIFIYLKQNEIEQIKVLSRHRKHQRRVHAHCSPPGPSLELMMNSIGRVI